jgi:hypothetical protein
METYRRRPSALESCPVNLVVVEIDQGPVSGEVLGAVGDGNGRGVDDVTDYALVRSRPLFGDLSVDLVYILDPHPRILHWHQVLEVLARAGLLGHLALNDRTQPLKLLFPCLNGEQLVADGAHHTVDGIGVGIGAEDDDLLTSLVAALAR